MKLQRIQSAREGERGKEKGMRCELAMRIGHARDRVKHTATCRMIRYTRVKETCLRSVN